MSKRVIFIYAKASKRRLESMLMSFKLPCHAPRAGINFNLKLRHALAFLVDVDLDFHFYNLISLDAIFHWHRKVLLLSCDLLFWSSLVHHSAGRALKLAIFLIQ